MASGFTSQIHCDDDRRREMGRGSGSRGSGIWGASISTVGALDETMGIANTDVFQGSRV